MKDDGGPAFPESYSGDMAPHEGIGGGMSLRDWFAGMALQGVITTAIHKGVTLDREEVALNAYLISDAMLAARKENQ